MPLIGNLDLTPVRNQTESREASSTPNANFSLPPVKSQQVITKPAFKRDSVLKSPSMRYHNSYATDVAKDRDLP